MKRTGYLCQILLHGQLIFYVLSCLIVFPALFMFWMLVGVFQTNFLSLLCEPDRKIDVCNDFAFLKFRSLPHFIIFMFIQIHDKDVLGVTDHPHQNLVVTYRADCTMLTAIQSWKILRLFVFQLTFLLVLLVYGRSCQFLISS